MDIDVLRQRLSDCRDRWGEIAAVAGVSRKTLYRIADQPDYMPNLQTFLDLQRAIEEIESRPTADEPEPEQSSPNLPQSGNGRRGRNGSAMSSESEPSLEVSTNGATACDAR